LSDGLFKSIWCLLAVSLVLDVDKRESEERDGEKEDDNDEAQDEHEDELHDNKDSMDDEQVLNRELVLFISI
jgi:hypothetical protein